MFRSLLDMLSTPVNSVQWTPYTEAFPGDSFGPEGPEVSLEEVVAVQANLAPHKWSLQEAPAGHTWKIPVEYTFIEVFLKACVEQKLYNPNASAWNIGTDSTRHVLRFSELLTKLLQIMHTQSDLCVVPTNANNSSGGGSFQTAPTLAVCRVPPGADPKEFPPSYRSCLVPIEFYQNPSMVSEDYSTVQLSIYARRCLAQNPGRNSVYCILLSKSDLIVYVFDRNGYHATKNIPIHQDPLKFLYVLYRLTRATDIPENIFWHAGVQCLSVLHAPTGETLCFKVERVLYVSRHILGHGTTCWIVQRPADGQRYLIKTMWVEHGAFGEYGTCLTEPEVLDVAHAGHQLEGVAPIFAHTKAASGYLTIKGMVEAPSSLSDPHERGNFMPDKELSLARLQYFVAMEYYERDVGQCQQPMELLHVIRDALRAHENLWKAGLCHRDICPKNIRIISVGGRTTAMLTGLDRARSVGTIGTIVPSMSDAGASKNLFQSFHLLSMPAVMQRDPSSVPDYWDDLESFFYVLCYLCGQYQGRLDLLPMERKVLNDEFEKWESTDYSVSAAAKISFCTNPLPDHIVPPSRYHKVLLGLLNRMRQAIYDHAKHWETTWNDCAASGLFYVWCKDLRGYDRFTYLLDHAMEEIERIALNE